MTSIRHLIRLIGLPLAMSAFLVAAQFAGGLTLRSTDHIQIALR